MTLSLPVNCCRPYIHCNISVLSRISKVKILTYLSVKRITSIIPINIHSNHHNHNPPYKLTTLNLASQKLTITSHKLDIKIKAVRWIFNSTWQRSKTSTKTSQPLKSSTIRITHIISHKKASHPRKNPSKINYYQPIIIINLFRHWLKGRTIIIMYRH